VIVAVLDPGATAETAGAGGPRRPPEDDRRDGRMAPPDFGFIEMPWHAHAVAAIRGLDGIALKGRTINVSRARPRSDGGSRENPSRGWAVVGDGRHRW
jgi:RNA recognition motif-containing protein